MRHYDEAVLQSFSSQTQSDTTRLDGQGHDCLTQYVRRVMGKTALPTMSEDRKHDGDRWIGGPGWPVPPGEHFLSLWVH